MFTGEGLKVQSHIQHTRAPTHSPAHTSGTDAAHAHPCAHVFNANPVYNRLHIHIRSAAHECTLGTHAHARPARAHMRARRAHLHTRRTHMATRRTHSCALEDFMPVEQRVIKAFQGKSYKLLYNQTYLRHNNAHSAHTHMRARRAHTCAPGARTCTHGAHTWPSGAHTHAHSKISCPWSSE